MTTTPPAVTAPYNALAALQGADCVTTHIWRTSDLQNHTENDPIARVLHTDTSLPMCFATAAVLNIVVRRIHNPLLTGLAIGVESYAVGHNTQLIVRWRVPL